MATIYTSPMALQSQQQQQQQAYLQLDDINMQFPFNFPPESVPSDSAQQAGLPQDKQQSPQGDSSTNVVDESTKRLYDKFLIYLPDYKVLVCKACRFAVQPKAIDTHLKQHQIYRERRSKLLAFLQGFDLAEPASVSQPLPDTRPIRPLPVYNGFRCSFVDCGFTCASSKRMKGHWTTLHNRPGTEGNDWTSVSLQTFFRGNQIRYFEVDTIDWPLSPSSGPSGNEGDDHAQRESPSDSVERSGAVSPLLFAAMSKAAAPPLPLSFNMDDMLLFQHFLTHTSTTIVRGCEPDDFYTNIVPRLAYTAPYLMSGVLSLSAAHLAHLRRDVSLVAVASRHQSIALPEYQKRLLDNDTNSLHADALIVYAKLLCLQEFAFMSLHSIGATEVCHSTTNVYGPKAIILYMRGGCKLLMGLRERVQDKTIANSLLPSTPQERAASLRATGVLPITSHVALGYLPRNEGEGIPPLEPMLAHRLWEVSQKLERMLTPQECRGHSSNWHALCAAFAVAYGSPMDSHLWDGVELWAGCVEDKFLPTFDLKDVGLVVMLAHYCILLKMLETRHWFMQGVAQETFKAVLPYFQESQKELIEWPLAEFPDT